MVDIKNQKKLTRNLLFMISKYLIAILATLFGGVPKVVYAYDFRSEGIYYSIINGDIVSVTSGDSKYKGDIVIPNQVSNNGKTYNVTSILGNAFQDCISLSSITIPNSVTSISANAFNGCTSLSSISIPNSVTSIGREAFEGTAWYNNQSDGLVYAGKVAYKYKGVMPANTHVTIKDGTIGIAESAFEDCSMLTSINIPNSVICIGQYAFDGTAWYNSQPDGVVYAGKVAYKYKGVMPANTHITIKNGTLGIAGWAFFNLGNLTSITIPKSVTSIVEGAFLCSGLASVKVESGNIKYDSRNNCNAIIETSSNTLIIGCKNTIIPNTVTAIGNNAFECCFGLTSVKIPSSVSSIGCAAFNLCTDLTSVTIPESVRFIGPSAFSQCDLLNSVTIPNSVTSIGDDTFYYCKGLTSVTIPNSVTSIGEHAFWYCTSLPSITIPNSVTSIGLDAFRGCSNLKNVVSEIQKPFKIGYYVFEGIPSDAVLIVPKGTKALYQATEGWNKFAKITEAADANTFTENGIYYILKSDGTLEVTGLDASTTVADIPSSITVNGTKYHVTSIGDYAFDGRSDITYLSLQYSIKSIGEYAFRDCGSSMTVNIANLDSWCKMELGNKHSSPLSSAGKVLLYDVETTSISIPETITSIGKYTFYKCRSLTSLYISGSVTSIGSSAFEDCTGLTSVSLGNGLTSIGGSAFEDCTSLFAITIPVSVTSIALNAFKNCSNLKNVTSEILTPFAIQDNVFEGIASDATLTVPKGTKSAYQSTTGWNKFAKITETTTGIDDPATQYFTFVAKENGTFSFSGTSSDKVDNSVIYYSLDSGASWTALARNVQSPTIQAGKRIMFKGTLTPLYYDVNDGEAISGIGSFSSTGRFDVEGNIMSLLYGENFIGQTNLTGKDHTFYELFLDCTGLISADNLVLPATTLADNCYEGMFRNCTSLTIAPQLPATKLTRSCYEGMFYNCTSLTTIPQLQASSLGISCYCYMFGGCTSLSKAPKLPAVTLTEMCYRSMFRGCKSLTIAPQLPATTLTSKCYEYMFDGCASLREMTCLATDISASDCTGNWLSNVASTGTFTKSSSMNLWTRGANGIPTNWTILNDNGSSTNEFAINSISYVVDNSTLTAEVKSVDNSLRSVIIPESINYNEIAYRVTSLAERSFEGRDDITYLSIPSSINSIGEYAFMDCGSNIKVNIESLEAWCKVKFGNQHSSPLSSAKSFYLNDVEVKNLSIPSGVTSISSYAFYQCRSITSLSIPSTVTSIISSVFEDCTGLTSITLSKGLTSIGGSSFEGCTGITSITIPSTVTSIALNAFKECNSLNDITSEIQQPFAIEENVFSTYSTATLKVPAGTKSAYQSTAGWSLFKNITDGQAEKDDVLFAIDGLTYQGTKSAKTVLVTSVNNGLVSVEIPASVSYEGTTYQVTGIDNDVFKGSSMAALIWDVEAVLPNNAFSNASIGSNFLLYVKSSSYAPSSVKNVVVDGTAQTIVLSDDGGQFYCPQAFTARNISYTHNYSMETDIGKAKGWESLALPFDVQKISHNTRGEIVPFPSYNSSSTQKPFWLANFSGNGFRRTAAVLANEPYIIAMPNSSSYRNEYNLAGDVTFSADNVQVPKTPSFSGTFLPAFATVAKSSSVYALNVNNRHVKYSGNYDAGSRFIANLRDVRPFEAYISNSSTRGIIEINFDDGTTDMFDILLPTDENQEVTIHTLSGQQITRITQRDFETIWQQLPKGVYIVNGKKWIK